MNLNSLQLQQFISFTTVSLIMLCEGVFLSNRIMEYIKCTGRLHWIASSSNKKLNKITYAADQNNKNIELTQMINCSKIGLLKG